MLVYTGFLGRRPVLVLGMNLSMKKLLVLAGVAAILVGCGGGDGPVVTSGGGGGGGGLTYPSFILGTGGLMQTVFLSGEGRTLPRVRGAGNSQIAVIKNVRYQNSAFDFIPTGASSLADEVRILLDGYTINAKAFGVQFGIGESSQSFSEYPLEIAQFLQRNDDGTTSPLTSPDSTAFAPPVPFDAEVSVFPGRISSLSVRLDDTMVGWDIPNGVPAFNPDIFIAGNYNPIYNAMVSQFSDYISFDISGVDSAPTLSISGDPADRVYFSGDGYAMSVGMGSGSEFELLDPIVVQNGKVTTGPPIGPAGSQIDGANLFILDDTGPDTSRFTSVIGTWYEHFNKIISSSEVTGVAFPTSRETGFIDTNERQQFVLYKSNGNSVTDLWYGSIFYNPLGDPTQATFKLYPVETIDDAIPASEVEGTISNILIVNGSARRGDWTVTGPTPGGWPFGSTGTFGVYRR